MLFSWSWQVSFPGVRSSLCLEYLFLFQMLHILWSILIIYVSKCVLHAHSSNTYILYIYMFRISISLQHIDWMCIPCTIIFLSQQSCYFAAFCSSWPQLLPGVRSCLSLKYLFLFQNHACTNCTYIQHIYVLFIYIFCQQQVGTTVCCYSAAFPQVGKSCSQGWDHVYL